MTGLDPVCVLGLRLRIAPQAKVQLTFATAASDDDATLRAMIDKYHQPSHVQRASLMSATLAGIRLRAARISPTSLAAIQTLTTALLLTLTRPQRAPATAPAFCDRRLLWRMGISGERPIVLVSASASHSMSLLRTLMQALRIWAWGAVPCDLVVINAELASYQMPLLLELQSMRERLAAEVAAQPGAAQTGLYVLRLDELSAEELSTLQCLARIHLKGDGRPLSHHVLEWSELHELALQERQWISSSSASRSWPATAGSAEARAFSREFSRAAGRDPSHHPARSAAAAPPVGQFTNGGSEFQFDVLARSRPPRPWINVMANAGFGTHLSEAGGGHTWALNSRLNQLTAGSNDPVSDPACEHWLLQDRRTQEVWSLCPGAHADPALRYQVVHGQGSSRISHRRGDLEVSATWCVDAGSAIKQVRVWLRNHGQRTLQLRAVAMLEWTMGAQHADSSTVHTALQRQRLGPVPSERKLTALLCTQQDHAAGFGLGTAFLATAGAPTATDDWTCDRREFFDARGALVLPDHLGQRSGAGLDPCAALATSISIGAGESRECTYLVGYAASPQAAAELATLAAAVAPATRQDEARKVWDELLGASVVSTPDPLFDALVNRWLLYQTVSCRLWARAGFYQPGGAYGFRDQLQDSMALAWAAPQMLRAQILLCASRQFAQGDVQHWWHPPAGAGVRTHFSDDLLWLPHACLHYLQATADTALMDEPVAFLEGQDIPADAEDAYFTPTTGTDTASVYEHGARAIDRSLRTGAHGLPLMGSGDWNDGMNRVGHQGRGESVWLAFFLCPLVERYATLAQARGEQARAARWLHAAEGWKAALTGPAWDGQWFKRAFFDDGQPLGSRVNQEARIDLIAQAWSVLSGVVNDVVPAASQRLALEAVQTQLVDAEAGLVRLLDPPLAHAEPSAGYIQAYPPGVRENGGQYSHGAVWALMAQAAYASAHADADSDASDARQRADTAYRWFTFVSPAHRAAHATHGPRYGIEPYVMAGDVYSQPPYVGRGGWSWYTGAAAWLHRAAIESIFGLKLAADELHFEPCLPSHWPQAELVLRRDERSMRFVFARPQVLASVLAAVPSDSGRLAVGEALRWPEVAPLSCYVISLRD